MKQQIGVLLVAGMFLATVGCSTRSERLSKVLSLDLERFYSITDLPIPKQFVGFTLTNKAHTPIKAIKGRLILTDLFDQELRSFELVIDETVSNDTAVYRTLLVDYDRLNPEHTRLNAKTFSQVKAIWEPEKILFMDGTTLE